MGRSRARVLILMRRWLLVRRCRQQWLVCEERLLRPGPGGFSGGISITFIFYPHVAVIIMVYVCIRVCAFMFPAGSNGPHGKGDKLWCCVGLMVVAPLQLSWVS